MISKERLEELIEQGATIYWIYGKSIEKKTLKHKYHSFFICDNELNEYNAKQYIGIWKHKLSKLFETKEEAEWHKEFGCIERTEKLYLPPFEEVFNDLQGRTGEFVIADPSEFSFAIKKSFSDQILLKTMYEKYNWNFTKENYTLACRKAKELFLKGNVND